MGSHEVTGSLLGGVKLLPPPGTAAAASGGGAAGKGGAVAGQGSNGVDPARGAGPGADSAHTADLIGAEAASGTAQVAQGMRQDAPAGDGDRPTGLFQVLQQELVKGPATKDAAGAGAGAGKGAAPGTGTAQAAMAGGKYEPSAAGAEAGGDGAGGVVPVEQPRDGASFGQQVNVLWRRAVKVRRWVCPGMGRTR